MYAARSLLLAAIVAVVPACNRTSPVPASAAVPAGAATSPARAVVRAFSIASPETIRLSPSESEQENRDPTVDYASLEIARDSIGAMVRRSVNPAAPSIRVSMAPAGFRYWYAADSVDGWAFHIVVTDTSECPDVPVEKALEAAGWAMAPGYSADGPDGTVMGFVTRRFLCVLEGRWDGGDDSDSTYVPEPGCEVTVTCVPRSQKDVPKW